MLYEYVFCGDTFDFLYQVWKPYVWNCLYEKVNVVFINTYLEEVYVIGGSKFQAYCFQGMRHSVGEDVSAVLYRTDEMIDEECLIVWFFEMLWFSLHTSLVYLESPPMQACGEKIDYI